MLCPCSTTRLRVPIKSFWGSVSSKCRVPDCLLESVLICCGRCKNQTCLIFSTTVTDPHSPLPTNIPVSDFLRPPQTEIYTILGCLKLPGTHIMPGRFSFSSRRSGLNSRFNPDPPYKRKNKNRPLLSEEISY